MDEPRIETLEPLRLVGISSVMSFAENRTRDLWQRFMPLRATIPGRVGDVLYAVDDFAAGFFDPFDPTRTFTKWAAVQVEATVKVADGMGTLILSGEYAVFIHRGPPSAGPATYRFVLSDWLPRSPCRLDDRPHFWKMGSGYLGDHPDSVEELWIPIALDRPRW